MDIERTKERLDEELAFKIIVDELGNKSVIWCFLFLLILSLVFCFPAFFFLPFHGLLEHF